MRQPIVLDLSSTLPTTPGLFAPGGWLFSYAAATVIMGVAILGSWMHKVSHDYQLAKVLPSPAPSAAKDSEPKQESVGRITGMEAGAAPPAARPGRSRPGAWPERPLPHAGHHRRRPAAVLALGRLRRPSVGNDNHRIGDEVGCVKKRTGYKVERRISHGTITARQCRTDFLIRPQKLRWSGSCTAGPGNGAAVQLPPQQSP